MQEFRALINWPVRLWVADADKEYLVGKELQRPQFGPVEKNWFIFWDSNGDMYLHHDIAPKLSFVKMDKNGSISEDLAPLVAGSDANGSVWDLWNDQTANLVSRARRTRPWEGATVLRPGVEKILGSD
jgi:hypothetical protein